MEGILAVGGFWLFLIALVMKKPLITYLENKKSKGVQEADSKLMERVHALEGSMVTVGKDIQEMKDTSEFAHKLMIDSAQQIAEAHKLLSKNSQDLAEAQRLLATAKHEAGTTQVTVIAQAKEEPRLIGTNAPMINELGKIIDDSTVRFERLLPAPIERVWQYLTSSECLPEWLAEGSIDQRFGGKVKLQFDVDETPERAGKGENIEGTVSFIDPLRALAFSWGEPGSDCPTNVSMQVSEVGDQTTLVLTHSQLPAEAMAEAMAGWHAHLDVLKARLADATPPAFSKRFKEVLQTYVAIVATTIVATTIIAQPVSASSLSDDSYVAIKTQRSRAAAKYDAIARDADDLKRRIADLKRDNSAESDSARGSLERKLDSEYRDMKDLELTIRDLDNAMK
ncbi:MAG: hypothetical protein C0507_14835 [Cyanobacteria bacterium PR.3.49]|nr:hypothetical protein [Cyanobacteria bacterium PR.3.49]